MIGAASGPPAREPQPYRFHRTLWGKTIRRGGLAYARRYAAQALSKASPSLWTWLMSGSWAAPLCDSTRSL
jgi:hypothetical protein